jgi:hypothetical protein
LVSAGDGIIVAIFMWPVHDEFAVCLLRQVVPEKKKWIEWLLCQSYAPVRAEILHNIIMCRSHCSQCSDHSLRKNCCEPWTVICEQFRKHRKNTWLAGASNFLILVELQKEGCALGAAREVSS